VRESERRRRTQLACLWCAPIGLTLFLIGMLMAGALPPPAAHDTARQIADRWADHNRLKQAGALLMMFSGTLLGPFVAVISVHIKRIEGRASPLAYTQLGLGMLQILIFVGPPAVMEVAAFRPHRDPSLILFANDLAWLPFVGFFFFFFVQCLSIAAATFNDVDGLVFPRWFGYLNIWVAVSFLPAGLIYFFKTGPFAYQGFLTYWLPFAFLGAWFVTLVIILRTAINDSFAHAEPHAA
jgi:hypothetical protein